MTNYLRMYVLFNNLYFKLPEYTNEAHYANKTDSFVANLRDAVLC